METPDYASPAVAGRRDHPLASLRSPRMVWLYAAEWLASCAGTWMQVGIFFFTQYHLKWDMRANLLLGTAQGVTYIAGALSAHAISARLGRRNTLVLFYALAAVMIGVAALRPTAVSVVVPVLIAYAFVSGVCWPILESLVSGRAAGAVLSGRLGVYNLVWSLSGAMVMAVNGRIIEYSPRGVFVGALASHAIAVVLMQLNRRAEDDHDVPEGAGHALHAETELLAQRRLALWLSRVALPATYVVIYGLSTMLPSLPLMRALTPSTATAVVSVWMIVRTAAFVVLGLTSWWHTRPRLLLLSAVMMLVAFLGVVIPASRFSAGAWPLAMVIGWQVVLGVGMGIVYSASLYFGMVLSEGSTEHGGYHEALIGAGSVLGPGLAAVAQLVRPGDASAIATVAAVIGACVVLAGAASVRLRRG